MSVVLNMTLRQLSFKKNGKDLGVAFEVPPAAYHLAVALYGNNANHKIRIKP